MILAVVAGVVLGAVVAGRLLAGVAARSADRRLGAAKRRESAALVSASRRRSDAVLRGQVSEAVVPLFAAFPYDASDARFLGKPIDYVVFDGYSEVRSGLRDDLREIVFLDVKTGAAGLSLVERRIRDCVEEGRVTCEAVTIEEP